jgi:hypothetical protein
MAKNKERKPTREELSEWYALRYPNNEDRIAMVQPTAKRAEFILRMQETKNGWLYREPLVSTIHDRCGYCNKVIVRRHNGIVPWDACIETQYDVKYWHMGVSIKRFDVCLGCFNKKRSVYRALKEWDETRRRINHVHNKVRQFKKEQENEQNQNNG